MSTKIYHGFRFLSSDMIEVHQNMMEWRKRVVVLTETKKAQLLAAHAVRLIDKAAVDGQPLPESPLGDAWSDMRDRQSKVKKTGYRDPEIDFDFEVSIMPFEGKLYGIVYCEQGDWRKEFFKQGWTEEFSYWDNTDRPRKITAKDWAERGRIWDAIWDQSPYAMGPAAFGFSADCKAPDYRFTKPKLVAKAAPKLEARARRLAKDVVFAQIMTKLRAEAEAKNGEELDEHQNMQLVFKAIPLVDKEEGQAMVATEIARITPLLPPKITSAMLTPNWKQLDGETD